MLPRPSVIEPGVIRDEVEDQPDSAAAQFFDAPQRDRPTRPSGRRARSRRCNRASRRRRPAVQPGRTRSYSRISPDRCARARVPDATPAPDAHQEHKAEAVTRNAIPRVAGDIPERDVPPLGPRQPLEPRPGGEFEQERVVRHIRDSGFGVRRVPGSGFRFRFSVRSFRTRAALGTTGTERLRSSLQTCPVSNFSSSMPARAIAAGRSRRTRGRCRERSIARCVRCPGGGNSSCTGQVEPMPASMRSRRSRTWSCTRTCRRSRCAARSTTSCPPTFTSARSTRRRTGSTRGTTRVARCYLYQISRRRTAFGKPFVWWIREPLDVGAMRAAAASFVGMKNFEAFTADDPGREIHARAGRLASRSSEAGALVLVRVQGSHFLWKMVRRMVGVLAACGRGELQPRATRRHSSRTAERTQPPPRRWPRRRPACSSKPCSTKGTRHRADAAGDGYRA